MSLENFFGFDTGEGMSEAAFEAFKEKMAQASAQIAAIQKEEKKRRKKEDELIKILLKFIRSSHKTTLVLLISRALEQNLPANFILAMILLGNEDIQKEVGSFLFLAEPTADLSGADAGHAPADVHFDGKNFSSGSDKSLVFFREDETLPLRVKIELDTWVKGMLFQAEETPEKLIKTAYDIEFIEEKDEETDQVSRTERRSIKTILVQLAAHVLRDYLEGHNLPNSYESLSEFAAFLIKGILDKTAENLENRKMLNGAGE